MKLHYSKILFFCLPLNILAHNKNKPYITTNTPITTSRVLIECNIYMPNYDYDPDMKSVKENFNKQTEQRFHEYDKRMIKNRKKYNEQCDKEIQKIILKDKIEKTLVEKVEKGCLMCGCGLGGVATSVGVLGTAVVYALKTAAMDAAIGAGIAGGEAEGVAAGHAEGAAKVIAELESQFHVSAVVGNKLGSIVNAKTYIQASDISQLIQLHHTQKCTLGSVYTGADEPFCNAVTNFGNGPGISQGEGLSSYQSMKIGVETIVSDAKVVAEEVTKTATEKATAALITKKTGEVNAIYSSYQTAIIASVVAILVIVLVMVIIYLILSYRRKKKMNKRLQYTKLLNQ
ncbi:PIR protein, putative [Plasmodium sp. gorilla clade G1]|nr:PIR protein, putative [Plasmodium sp. gorilla clade G1]